MKDTGGAFVACIRSTIGHKHRIKHGAVYKFDPFEENSHCWNPVQEIVELEDEEEQWEAARLMADMLIVSKENGNSYRKDEARNLLTAIILYVVLDCPENAQNIAEVRHFATQSESGMSEFVQARLQAHHNTTLRRAGNVFSASDN